MTLRKQVIIGIVAVVFIVICIGITGGFEKNDAQNWQHIQPIRGEQDIRDVSGWYFKNFATITTIPRYIEFHYNDVEGEGAEKMGAIPITFNDGGNARISTYIRIQTPTDKKNRLKFHRQFGGDLGEIKSSIKSYMIYCLKSTATLMSSSENQTARKTEFQQVSEGQLRNGTYKTIKKEIVTKDITDTTGHEITLYKTELVLDDNGNPEITQLSPLIKEFNMTIVQFSITGTAYEPDILAQFTKKKEIYLQIEGLKADREKENQDRLMIIERGKKDKAKAEATAKVLMATAVIAAQQRAEVALQAKQEAETKAAQKLSVAKLDKETLLMGESAKFDQSVIQAKTANKQREAMILKAEGKQQAIELSGAITELEQAMLNAEVDKVKFGWAGAAKIQVPTTMFITGSGGTDGANNANVLTTNLVNLKLMEAAGLLDKINVNKSSINRKINRNK